MLRFTGLLLALVILGVSCGGDDAGPSPGGPADSSSTQSGGSREPSEFPASLRGAWKTDFSKASINPDELVSGGPGKDGIPALSSPKFSPASEVTFLKDREPVIAFEEAEDARAYPLQILTWHEIVNDVVGGRAVMITFCPLCNTAIAFDRVVSGRTLEFGVSGLLRNSDMVMFDRETESWWQQVTGEAIVGELTGTQLELLPSSIVSWADFKSAFPDGHAAADGKELTFGVSGLLRTTTSRCSIGRPILVAAGNRQSDRWHLPGRAAGPPPIDQRGVGRLQGCISRRSRPFSRHWLRPRLRLESV